jgi:hypothetical protein
MQTVTDRNRRGRFITHSLTMKFTDAEARKINRATKICGWQRSDNGEFCQNLLMRMVTACLTEKRTTKRNSKSAGTRISRRGPQDAFAASLNGLAARISDAHPATH